MAIPFVMINLDKPYKLKFGMGAQVEFEQLTGIKVMSIQDEISVELCAKMLWVMLKQEDKEITLEKTCQLVDEYANNMTDVIQTVSKAIEAAFKTSLPNVGKPKK